LFDLAADPLDGLLQVLWQTPGWPQDEMKDRALLAALRLEYPRKDLAGEIARWQQWMREHPERVKEEGNWRGRLRTWFSRERFWADKHRRARRESTGRVGTSPVSRDDWGESSTSLTGF
jgi:hypothetical protein